MARLTPLVRISVGLVMMTCSILLAADMFGLLPQKQNQMIEARIQLCERLALHAVGRSRQDLAALRRILEFTTRRDEDLISVGVREPAGRLVLATAEHRDHWKPKSAQGSTASHIRVPLLEAGRRWATLEVRFRDPSPHAFITAFSERTVLPVILFVMALGSIGYYLYMRRTLRHLDPSAVIPTRVQMALDVMAEGVVLIDRDDQIVLANSSFVEQVGVSRGALLGTLLRDIDWRHKNAPGIALPLPWGEVLRDSKKLTGTEMTLARDGEERVFVVNASPVLDGWDKAKGAIVTFDDVTELTRRTAALERSNTLLEKSQEEIELRNQELEVLSRQDPLTGVSNRRAFLESLLPRFEAACRDLTPFSCVMVDIDHFKKINDNHGHSMGDEVIRAIADTLRSGVRERDRVCRWGGEEFILFFDEDTQTATSAANRLRAKIASPGFTRVPITVSLGVATVSPDVASLQQLIDRADAALYASKRGGRNQVTRWDEMEDAANPSEDAIT